MKSSLIWRFIVIVAVLAAWTYSMFPLKDRDYMLTFRQTAEKSLRQYRTKSIKSRAKADRVKAKLDAMAQQKDTPKYGELETEKNSLEAEAAQADEQLKGFDQLMAEAEKLQKENKSWAPYMAIREASKGGSNHPRVALNRFIAVPSQPRASNSLVLSYVRRLAAGKIRLGLDLRGGTEFIIGFNAKDVPSERRPEDVRDQILEILRNRVDSMGVAEPEIMAVGPTSISLRMPSVSESDKADIRRTIKQTAKLEFRIVDPANATKVSEYRADPKKFRPTPGYEYYEIESEQDGRNEVEIVFLKSRSERLRGEDVSRAVATFNEFGNYAVSLSFNSRGAADFARITGDNVGQRLAIVLDGKVYSAPVIREAITGGNAQISGSFSPEEARRLAGVIESGNLPVSITIDSEFGTDPTMGRDSVHSGMMAAIWGLAGTVFFMVLYYHVAGVVAVIALTANMILLMGTMTLTGATITMPGIAGIILGIGMAVDSNVLIYERMREEMASGKTLANTIKASYSRVFMTIFDSNLTTIITALILYYFGSGSVRGFAVTLTIGIVVSMFTALFMTRWIFDFGLYSGWLKRLTMLQLFRKLNIDYMAIKWQAIAFSGVLILACIVGTLVRGRDVLSIDFAGGTQAEFRYKAATFTPDIGAIRDLLEKGGFRGCRVGVKHSALEEGRVLELVLPSRSTDEASLDLDKAVTAKMNEKFANADFQLVRTNSVGGLVGARFQRQAIIALVLSWIGIILYVAFRFELAYGVAGVVALMHDAVIAGGLAFLLGRQLSLPVMAAILTVIGFSINDTIVIFDRVRESRTLYKGMSYRELVNLSVNQTMSRTILTTLTVLITVLTLFLFGGSTINDFSLVMLIGVISGTYSTIFIASVIVVVWHKRARIHADD